METPSSFDFPFEPYAIQHNFMKFLYEVIENKQLGIFESPTGTGKSLSIICGAIRWLKDHRNFEKMQLQESINDLEAQKGKIAANSSDWLTSQAEEIELTRRINELKIQQKKINEYETKLENMKIKSRQKTYLSKPETVIVGKENEEDEDIILDSCTNDEKEEIEEDEEEGGKHKPVQIYICSRTHSQLSQFVKEILKSPFAKDLKVASLASRQNYCINPNVNKLKSNALINDSCLDRQKKPNKKQDSDGKVVKKQKSVTNSKCPFFNQTRIEDLKDLVLNEVQDVEDLVKKGKKLSACPYYSSRLAAEDADLVLVPYNTILHKATREANGIKLKNNIIIIDEAHNLLEAMAQMHSVELGYNQIEQGLIQLKCYKQRFNTRFSASNLLLINQLIFVLTKLMQFLGVAPAINFLNLAPLKIFQVSDATKSDTFTVENFVLSARIGNYNMFKLVKFCQESRIAQKVRSYALKYPFDKNVIEKKPKKGVQDFLLTLSNKNCETLVDVKATPFPQTNSLLAIVSFLDSLTYSYSDGRIFVHSNADKNQTKLQFLLLNPCQNFQEILNEARSVIVAGGTMKPYEEFKNRLFVNAGASPERVKQFSCNHVIPPDNILPIIVTQGPNHSRLLFNYQNRMTMGDNVKLIIKQICKVVIGGIVVFFPSYNYENWIWQQIKDLSFGRPVFREPQDSGSVETVLKSYADVVAKSKSALLLSVVGGKLSEGLNFNDDLGRCVIVVGLPYANVKAPDLKEKMLYLDKTEGTGAGQKFYENLCMKAVNQSIGRAVRHKNDYATILLLDERFNRTSTKNALPDWIQKSLQIHNFETALQSINKFFQQRSDSL